MEQPACQSALSPSVAEADAAPRSLAVLMPSPRGTIAELFEAEEGSLLRFATGLVRQRAVAEELVQETFLRLHPLWAQIDNPRAWLYRCLRNLALNHLRDHSRETELGDREHAADERSPDDAVAQAEAVGTVRLLLAALPEDERQLVRLKYHEGLKYEQISCRTGLSVGNVGYKLHHVLKNLADALRRAGIEGSRG